MPFQEIARLLAADALSDAVEQAKSQVKADPTDKAVRHLYIDLLILSAAYEDADAQCILATTIAPDASTDFSHLRNQLRAMVARRAWFEAAKTPAFPSDSTEFDEAALTLGMANRTGEHKLTQTALKALEDDRGERPMRWNGKLFPDFRDLDDRTPHALEIMSFGGAYLWIDFSRIATVTVDPIIYPRDLAFRRAQLSLLNGVSTPVMLPAIYPGSGDDPKFLLGRETRWVKETSGITTGRGQRCFLAGEELVSLHDTTSISNVALDAMERNQGGQSA